jgi:hypothetical protein
MALGAGSSSSFVVRKANRTSASSSVCLSMMGEGEWDDEQARKDLVELMNYGVGVLDKAGSIRNFAGEDELQKWAVRTTTLARGFHRMDVLLEVEQVLDLVDRVYGGDTETQREVRDYLNDAKQTLSEWF